MNSDLHAKPHGLFSWNYSLSGAGKHAELITKWTRESGQIIVNGETLMVRKHGWLSGHWSVLRNGKSIGGAQKSSFLTRTFEIKCGKGTFELSATSMFSRTMKLKGPGHNLLITPKGIFTRKARLSGPWEDFTLVAFAMWLSVTIWKRQSSSNS